MKKLFNNLYSFAILLILTLVNLGLVLITAESFAQPTLKQTDELRKKLKEITSSYHADIGISLMIQETGDTCTVNNNRQYPMQSVYKFPLAISVLRAADQKKILLSQKIHVSKKDLKPHTWSPLRDKYPEGNIDLSVSELLEYTISKSDNNTCDILFQLMNGTKQVEQDIHSMGYKQIAIKATEEEIEKTHALAYKNWCFPSEMTRLLAGFIEGRVLSVESQTLLMKMMTETDNSPLRLKEQLPPTIKVAHKTGTGNNIVNDVGIITLPDGRHLIISVFIMNAKETYESAEKIIASISRLSFDFFTNYSFPYIEKKQFDSGLADTLPYRLIHPIANNLSQKYPLLVYLHGSGLRGNDNEGPLKKLHPQFTDAANRNNYPAYILVPQCPLKGSWVWFPMFPHSLASTDTPSTTAKQTIELIRVLIRDNNIDPDRIYLTGFSLGGEGTFDFISREPDLFACGVPLAAVADTSRAKQFLTTPIWAFHGTDDQVNDIRYCRMMIDALKKRYLEARLTEFFGVQHDCRTNAYGNPELWHWIFEQRKKRTKNK